MDDDELHDLLLAARRRVRRELGMASDRLDQMVEDTPDS